MTGPLYGVIQRQRSVSFVSVSESQESVNYDTEIDVNHITSGLSLGGWDQWLEAPGDKGSLITALQGLHRPQHGPSKLAPTPEGGTKYYQYQGQSRTTYLMPYSKAVRMAPSALAV